MLARPLGIIERFYWLYDQQVTTNFVLIAELGRGPDRAALQEALARAWVRHPLLRCRIAVERGRVVRIPDAAPVPEVVEVSGSWSACADAELDRPFPRGSAPLVRAAWLGGAAVFTFHHGLLDARSAAWWLGEVLAGACGCPPATPLPREDRPAERLYPRRWAGLAGLLRLPAVLWPSTLEHYRAGAPATLPAAPPRGTPRRTHSVHLDLDPEQTAALRARARRGGFTVQAALAAAQLAALRGEHLGDADLALCVAHAVDLRPHLDPPLAAGTLGLCVSLLAGVHRVPLHPDLDALAREAGASLKRLLARGQAHLFWRALPPAWLLPPDARGAARLGFLARQAPPAAVVTNLGALPDLPAPAAEAVRAIRFLMAPQDGSPLCTAAAGLHGALRLGLCFDGAHLDPGAQARTAARFASALGG